MKVYCSHTFKESRNGNDCYMYYCPICQSEWPSYNADPKVVIGETDNYLSQKQANNPTPEPEKCPPMANPNMWARKK